MSDLRLPLAQRITTRDGTMTFDGFMANMYREESEGKIEAVKRPGTAIYLTQASPAAAQGMFSLGAISYSISSDRIYKIDFGVSFAIPAVTTFGLPYDIVSDVTFGLLQVAVIKTTKGLWYFDGTTVTKVTDADYPTTTVRGLVLVDGTFYVMTTDGIIQGSGLEDPTVWTALNFIGTDQSLGLGVRLFRHLNYCFAFNDLGLQAFYDNANPPPGSPLSPAGNATYLIGCASGASVVSLDDLAIFMSKSKQRGRSISALQGLSLVQISTPFIDKILNRSNLSSVQAFGVKIEGHSFYVLTLLDLNLTLVCDLIAKDWAYWTTTVGATEGYFQFAFYLSNGTTDLLQHATTGSIYRLDPTIYQDASVNITCRVRTAPYDGQTALTKFFTALNLIGSQVYSTVAVRYSNDDYRTWSDYRDVDMNSERKQLRSIGSARRRAFDVMHTANTPLRLEAIDFELYLGNS
jgi:hypothetical protein